MVRDAAAIHDLRRQPTINEEHARDRASGAVSMATHGPPLVAERVDELDVVADHDHAAMLRSARSVRQSICLGPLAFC